jgi:hypothetical protein
MMRRGFASRLTRIAQARATTTAMHQADRRVEHHEGDHDEAVRQLAQRDRDGRRSTSAHLSGLARSNHAAGRPRKHSPG